MNASTNCLRGVQDTHGDQGYRDRERGADFPEKFYQDLLDLRRILPRP